MNEVEVGRGDTDLRCNSLFTVSKDDGDFETKLRLIWNSTVLVCEGRFTTTVAERLKR